MLLHGLPLPATLRGGFLTIGNFDGVHRGHQQIIRTLAERGSATGAPVIVLTFEPHPATFFRPAAVPPLLTRLARKVELLSALGVSAVLALPPRPEFFQLDPREFFEQVLVRDCGIRGIVEGSNFLFGRQRAGDVVTLQALGAEYGIEVRIVEPTVQGEQIVSSTEIRRALYAGDVLRAWEMLGRPHQVRGRVAAGAGRGRQLGFPTANLEDVQEQLPPDGVYLGLGHLPAGSYRAAIHLGPNPTFSEAGRKLEVHLLDFSGDLYGAELALDFCGRLRDLQRFETPAQLQQQLELDLQRVREAALTKTGD
jgi:riboflavin kinase/FMN adenylyltransferase